MNRGERLHLLGEKTALERMIAETPDEDVIDRASLAARLEIVKAALAQAKPDEREPARVRLTFQGRPVIGSHGIYAEFGSRLAAASSHCVPHGVRELRDAHASARAQASPAGLGHLWGCSRSPRG